MRAAGIYRLTKGRSKALTDGDLSEHVIEACICFNHASAYRLLLQITFCIVSIVLGIRISQEIAIVVHQFHYGDSTFIRFDHKFGPLRDVPRVKGISNQNSPGRSTLMAHETTIHKLPHPDERLPRSLSNATRESSSRGIQVGRHPILIREWPHPDLTELMEAYKLIARVQLEQERLYGTKDWKPIIAITPTYTRMFQAMHLTGLMHTLSLVRGPVTWIVIEAEGKSTITANLLGQARVNNLVHLGYAKPMPPGFEDRWIMESHLRAEGLRFVREKKLEGVIVFADDSNVYNMEFFNAVQKVNWVGALPLGILGYAGFQDVNQGTKGSSPGKRRRRGSLLFGVVHKGQVLPKIELRVQGLSCHSNGTSEGWHAYRPLPLDWESGKGTALLDKRLQWAGFVLNARTVWATESERPSWLRDWKEWALLKEGVYLDLRSLLKDERKLEPLGKCGSKDNVLHWWVRMEARADSKFLSGWMLNSPPKDILPARSTPWPEGVRNTTLTPPALLLGQTNKLIAASKSAADDKFRPSKRKLDAPGRKPVEISQKRHIM